MIWRLKKERIIVLTRKVKTENNSKFGFLVKSYRNINTFEEAFLSVKISVQTDIDHIDITYIGRRQNNEKETKLNVYTYLQSLNICVFLLQFLAASVFFVLAFVSAVFFGFGAFAESLLLVVLGFFPGEDFLLFFALASGFFAFFSLLPSSALSACSSLDFFDLGLLFSAAESFEVFVALLSALFFVEFFFFLLPSSPSVAFFLGFFVFVFLVSPSLSLSGEIFSFAASIIAFFSFFSLFFSSFFCSSFSSLEILKDPDAPTPFVCTSRPLLTLFTRASLI